MEKALKKLIAKTRKTFKKLAITIRQALCKHKETEKVVENSLFKRISGETVYIRCKKCEKILDSINYEYEGFGYK